VAVVFLDPANLLKTELIGPLIDQQIADRLFDKSADFLFSRRDHL
jgi:hypothetical protein